MNPELCDGRASGTARLGFNHCALRWSSLVLLLPIFLWMACQNAHGSTAYGSINNFDVVNDTGVECHGFEIEIEDLESRDITYTYDWNHYGAPEITQDNSDPLHPRVVVRYASARTTNGLWAAYTAIPSGPILPTDGHRFTDPSVNFGGEHFGVGYRGSPTNIVYHWLIDNGAGVLVRGPAVQVATPTFNYIPPGPGAAAQVQAAIVAPPAPPVLEFGPACWVKEIRTTTHNNHEIELRDLVADDPEDPNDPNWRNGEPDEVEVEWQILQTEFNKPNGGQNGELDGAPEGLPDGDEVITRRYEFYKYVGPVDEETGEAKADQVGPDDLHGVGLKTINGVEVDLSKVEVVGDYIGAQMSAFDVDASVGIIDHLQDGRLNEPYPIRTLIIPGQTPFTATLTGSLPGGMAFNDASGELSGTPTATGLFTFTIEARAEGEPPAQQTLHLTIAPPGEELPPRYTIGAEVMPLQGGTVSGEGVFALGEVVALVASPAAGFAFADWSEQGRVVSRSLTYRFTNEVNRALVATFVEAGPRLMWRWNGPQSLRIFWPTNSANFLLEISTNLGAAWFNSTNIQAVSGTNLEATVSLEGRQGFYRLRKE